MPKPTVFVVSAARYLLKEKRFLLTAVGVFVVFTLFTTPSFSMIAYTGGLRQLVDSDNLYSYLIQQAAAQEEGTITTPDEPFPFPPSTGPTLPPPEPPEPTPPFTPFSQEQEQEAQDQGAAPGEGGQQATTTPTVTSTEPVDGATDVAVNATAITATFSELVQGVDDTTFTIDGITGEVTYDSQSNTATFTPSENLAFDSEYIASLSSAITDAAGNPLTATEWSFTTAAEGDEQVPPGEEVPPGEGGQQSTTTPTNQTASNATNGTATLLAQPGQGLGGISTETTCILVSGVQYCLLPPNEPIRAGCIIVDYFSGGGTSGTYCPSVPERGGGGQPPITPSANQTTANGTALPPGCIATTAGTFCPPGGETTTNGTTLQPPGCISTISTTTGKFCTYVAPTNGTTRMSPGCMATNASTIYCRVGEPESVITPKDILGLQDLELQGVIPANSTVTFTLINQGFQANPNPTQLSLSEVNMLCDILENTPRSAAIDEEMISVACSDENGPTVLEFDVPAVPDNLKNAGGWVSLAYGYYKALQAAAELGEWIGDLLGEQDRSLPCTDGQERGSFGICQCPSDKPWWDNANKECVESGTI